MGKPLFSEHARKMVEFLQTHEGDFTFVDLANWVHITPRQANCTITSALTRKGYAERYEKDGIKYVRLTMAGRSVDPDAVVD